MPSCRRLLRHAVARPRSFALPSTGSKSAARMPIIEITTSTSTRVNASSSASFIVGRASCPSLLVRPAPPKEHPAFHELLHFLQQRRQLRFCLRGTLAVIGFQPDLHH